jgi:hypothetical protein
VGDIAVIVHSETGNTGKMVRITEETYQSDRGHDLVAQCLDATGLVYTVGYETDDGELEELEFVAMEIPMKSKNLRRIAGAKAD